MRRLLAICLTIAAAAALAVAPAAATAKKPSKKSATAPVITRVLPMRLTVGEQLTIRGRHFKAQRSRNTVIFRAPNGRTAFAKPSKATSTKLVVAVPAAVSRLLARSSSAVKPTRFKLRVLSGSFSKFTSRRLSPVVVGPRGGNGGNGGSGGPGTPGNAACNGADFDGDLLPNAQELALKTDPCLKDTDKDGIEDGYEYKSAVDLNDDDYQDPNSSLPYPGKRPYPNPLDSSDANLDFDGDVLTLAEEQSLWLYTIANGYQRTLTPLTYSDGEQFSLGTRGSDGRRQPTQPAAGYPKQIAFLTWAVANGYRSVHLKQTPGTLPPTGLYGLLDMNRDGVEEPGRDPDDSSPADGKLYFYSEVYYYDTRGDGWLSDDERDEDADGLNNYEETHGRITPAYWEGCYGIEAKFDIPYAGPSVVDPDSDGDGILDGADDQDHDDVPNVMELSRNSASGEFDGEHECKPLDSLPTPPATLHPDVYGRVNPFNPCLPDRLARTCSLHPGIGGDGAPFDGSINWASLN
jgi:hypothetical protein